jgi:hypothetical protein
MEWKCSPRIGRYARLRRRHPVPGGAAWIGVNPETVLEFLRNYRVDDQARCISIPLLIAYIERLVRDGELSRWTVAIKGLVNPDPRLGNVDWGLPTGPISQISRSRLGNSDSVGVVTSPGDEAIGLSADDRRRMDEILEAARQAGETKSESVAARQIRPATDALLILYPISRHSGYDLAEGRSRKPLYENPAGPLARDLVGLALSFPKSQRAEVVEAYVEGTVAWRPVE